MANKISLGTEITYPVCKEKKEQNAIQEVTKWKLYRSDRMEALHRQRQRAANATLGNQGEVSRAENTCPVVFSWLRETHG